MDILDFEVPYCLVEKEKNMKKQILMTIAALTLVASMPLTAFATETVPSNTPKTAPAMPNAATEQNPLDSMPFGVNIDTLWIAEAGKYDVTETGLERYDFAELAPGKTYEVAIHITNNSDRNIATPYGIDFEILLPRVVEAGKPPYLEVTARSDMKNTDDLWSYTWMPSAKIRAKEDVALVYKDQSNYVSYLEDGKPDAKRSGKAGFSWGPSSRLMERDNILLSATQQGLYAGTSKIVTFQFETVALSKWEELSADMRQDPVKVKVDDVYQSLVDGKVHISSTLLLPKWLRDQMKGADGYWRIMARPEIEKDGRVSVVVRVENHTAAYAAAVSNAVSLRGGSVELSKFLDATINDHTDTAKTYESYAETWVECSTSDYDFRKDESIKIDMIVSTR